MLTCEEVEIMLRDFGKISYCRMPSKIGTSSYNLGEGVIVQFDSYDEDGSICVDFSGPLGSMELLNP